MSQITRRISYGLVGYVTTKVARKATRNAMYDDAGEPKIPDAARQGSGLGAAVALAAATGAALALVDLLQEQRKRVPRRDPRAPLRQLPPGPGEAALRGPDRARVVRPRRSVGREEIVVYDTRA